MDRLKVGYWYLETWDRNPEGKKWLIVSNDFSNDYIYNSNILLLKNGHASMHDGWRELSPCSKLEKVLYGLED